MKARKMKTILVLLPILLLVACNGSQEVDPKIDRLGRATGSTNPHQMPPRGTMSGGAVQPVGEKPIHSGKVIETMNVPNYTYVKLMTDNGTMSWAAIPQTKIEVGQRVQISESLVMTKFTSPSLSRTFDSIIFGTLIVDESPKDGGVNEVDKEKPKPELPPGHPPIDK
jgi:hypothetical protein